MLVALVILGCSDDQSDSSGSATVDGGTDFDGFMLPETVDSSLSRETGATNG